MIIKNLIRANDIYRNRTSNCNRLYFTKHRNDKNETHAFGARSYKVTTLIKHNVASNNS